MKFPFAATRPQLRVVSAICANFVVVWLVAILATRDMLVLTRDIVLAILFWYLAIKAEERLENL